VVILPCVLCLLNEGVRFLAVESGWPSALSSVSVAVLLFGSLGFWNIATVFHASIIVNAKRWNMYHYLATPRIPTVRMHLVNTHGNIGSTVLETLGREGLVM
jgi:hypothetical protein